MTPQTALPRRPRPVPAAAAAAAAALLCVAGTTAQARTVSYGLAIGNNSPPLTSDAPLPVLAYADDDAVRYHQLFSRFCERSVLLGVLDDATGRRYPEAQAQARPPTLAHLRAQLSELSARMQADHARGDLPVLYLAFSGHGARNRDGALFLALADGELTRERLYAEILEKVPAAFVHLIIDACHAEGVVGVRGVLGPETDARAEPVTLQERQRFLEATTLARFPHVGVVLATAADQQAHEWSQLESGVFSHELLSALTGAADVNGDGAVEYSEVVAFVASTNRDVADERAVPKVVALPPRLNPHQPLVTLSGQSVAQLAGASRLGHFWIELENGQRYLDAHLSPDFLVRIAIPATRLFVVAEGGEAELHPRPGEVVRLERLPFRKRAVATRGAIEASLRKALFRSPYGPTYYRGYVDSAGMPGVAWGPTELSRSLAPGPQRKPLAVALFSVGGASLLAGVATGVLAVQARGDFDRTDLQRPAWEARQRVIRYSAAAAATATVGAAAILGGWLAWPGQDEVGLAAVAGPGQVGAVLAGRF